MVDTTVDTMARGQLMPRLTTAMAGMVDTDTAMARGPLTPRLTTATPDTDMVDTMARGPLTPRLTTATPDTDMVDTMARGQLMPRLTTATPDTDMVDTMARGPLTLRLTTASPDTDMADTLTASKMLTSRDSKPPPSQCNTPISKSRHPSQKFYKIRAKIFIPVQHPNFKIKTSEPKILQNPSQNLYPSATPQFQNQDIRAKNSTKSE